MTHLPLSPRDTYKCKVTPPPSRSPPLQLPPSQQNRAICPFFRRMEETENTALLEDTPHWSAGVNLKSLCSTYDYRDANSCNNSITGSQTSDENNIFISLTLLSPIIPSSTPFLTKSWIRFQDVRTGVNIPVDRSTGGGT